jgi:hypothetical protein
VQESVEGYKRLLANFNKSKSHLHREEFLHAKKYENKLKYRYKQHEGDMLDYLRKHNPKHFHSLFAKGKSKSKNCSLTNDDFFSSLQRTYGE